MLSDDVQAVLSGGRQYAFQIGDCLGRRACFGGVAAYDGDKPG